MSPERDLLQRAAKAMKADTDARWHPVSEWLTDAAIDMTEVYDTPWQPDVHAIRAAAAYLTPTPCPTCGGAGIVDTSPPGVEGSAP